MAADGGAAIGPEASVNFCESSGRTYIRLYGDSHCGQRWREPVILGAEGVRAMADGFCLLGYLGRVPINAFFKGYRTGGGVLEPCGAW